MTDEKNIIKDLLSYLENMPQVVAALIYDEKMNIFSYESVDEDSDSLSVGLHKNIAYFIENEVPSLKNEIKKIKVYFESGQCNVYIFSGYTAVILIDGKDELGLLDSLLLEYHDLSRETV